MRGHGIRELFLPHFLCSIGPFLLYPIFFFLLAAPDEVPQSQGPATGVLSRIFRAYPAQHSKGHRKINRPQFRDGLKDSVDRWLRILQAPRVPTMTSCSSFGPWARNGASVPLSWQQWHDLAELAQPKPERLIQPAKMGGLAPCPSIWTYKVMEWDEWRWGRECGGDGIETVCRLQTLRSKGLQLPCPSWRF